MGSPFEAIVGADYVDSARTESLAGVPIDEVVSPATAEELAECLALAQRDRVSLLARGGGSKLGWGNRGSAERWTVLSLARLDRVLRLDADEGIVQAQAGTQVAELAAELKAVGREIALPSFYPGATLGGSIAADPPGPSRSLAHELRQDILGLEVAVSPGTLTRCGGTVVKNVTGFDLARLYCGSLGSLGIVTQATLRLRPLLDARAHLVWTGDSLPELQRLCAVCCGGANPLDFALVEGREGTWRIYGELRGTHDDVAERLAALSDKVELDRFDDPAEWRCAVTRASAWIFEAASPVEESSRSEAGSGRAGSASDATAPSVRLRIGARPADLLAVLAVLERWSGVSTRRAVYPLSGWYWAEGDVEGLESLCQEVEARGWIWVFESRPEGRVGDLDGLGPAPQALRLMADLKRRFDPVGILAPGRFWGRI